MGKKGNKKRKNNKRPKKDYNKKEFCEVFCQTCLICRAPQPDFCYVSLYKHEAKPFINKVFNNLVEIHTIYQSMGSSTRAMSVEQFQNVVCRTGICFNGDGNASASCDRRDECYKEFMRQQGIPNPSIICEADKTDLIEFKNNRTNKRYISYNRKKDKKERKRKNKRYVCASYPTFFARDNADFQAEIRKILYGDNDNQQNKDKELPASDSGAADRDTKGGEPKV